MLLCLSHFLFDTCITFDIVGIGCAIIATGIPVYIVFIYWTSKPKDFNRFIGMSIAAQILRDTINRIDYMYILKQGIERW